MPRLAPLLLLAAAAAARAEPPAEAVALQKAVQRVIDAAEPSIACVLVSRSEQYARFGDGPPDPARGRLGGFDRAGFRGGWATRELVRRLDLAHPEVVPESYGSGVVIDDRGLVLTNFHVVANKVTKVYVRLPGAGRGSYANILAADPRADLAVLQMIRPPADLKAVPFGDGGKVRKGDWVVSLANPFAAGFRDGSPSASWGIVSNLRRRLPGPTDEAKRTKAMYQHGTLIQTDARLHLGTSGGALLNLDGQLVGLTTSLAAVAGGETAGGYAVPMDANTKKMVEVLKRGQEIEYGFLGVQLRPEVRGSMDAGGHGVAIDVVTPGMPASRAGLMAGDVIVAIDGNPVRDQDDLFLHISAALAGSEAEIEVRRGPRTRTVKARLAKSPTNEYAEQAIVSNRPRPVFGLRVDYTSTLSADPQYSPPEGVRIREVEPGSPAQAKLKGFVDPTQLIVVAVDGKPVPTPADFYRAAAGKRSVSLDVVEATREPGPKRERVTLP